MNKVIDIFGKEIEFECMGCDIANHKLIPPGGYVYEDEFIYGMVTNSVSVGGFKNLTGPNVQLDDGLFEVTFIRRPKNVFELQEMIASLLLEEDKTDMIISCKTGRIKVEAENEVAWTLDGEFGGNLKEVVIENEKQRMMIMQNKATDEELLLQFDENEL